MHSHQQNITLPCQRSPIKERGISIQREMTVQVLMCLNRLIQSAHRQSEPHIRHLHRMMTAIKKINLPVYFFSFNSKSLVKTHIRRKLPEYLYLIRSIRQDQRSNISQRNGITLPSYFISQTQIAQIFPVVYIIPNIARTLKNERTHTALIRTDFHLWYYGLDRRNIQIKKE